MTVQTDTTPDSLRYQSPLDGGSPPKARSKAAALKAKAMDIADEAKDRLKTTGVKAQALAGTAGVKAKAGAVRAAEEAKARPIATTLLLTAAGIGLFFLANRKARTFVAAAAPALLDAAKNREAPRLPRYH